MTFEQLSYFIAIVENDTFFDAACEMNISQSSLSKQIMKLEKELDLTLFDRTTRSATLTQAGEFFYNEAKQLIEHYKLTLENIEKFKSLHENKLHIAVLPIQTQYNLNTLFNSFRKENPNIELQITEVEDDRLIEGISKNEYDLIIARETMFDKSQFKTYQLAKDELIAAISSEHKLSQRDKLTFDDIKNENFILMNPYTSIYQLCINKLKENNIDANIIRTARTESIIGSVAINEGISLLPKSNFEVFHQKNINTISLEPQIALSVVLAKHKKTASNIAIKEFIKFVDKIAN
ncbi:MAG: LysR family transcriptional regulator [Intestinibacter bartlettii]|uniref:LysR family transcriptional regulator n=1 Tax=Intestinibacter bartlettii TaxID=261299 RepID=UPI00242B1FB8|nr:LysR family transcriptional regulator [Intestinibacter bartlettii]MBS7148235.1 LysR family transcriptional regulator [Intestinibacter bartlettii]